MRANNSSTTQGSRSQSNDVFPRLTAIPPGTESQTTRSTDALKSKSGPSSRLSAVSVSSLKQAPSSEPLTKTPRPPTKPLRITASTATPTNNNSNRQKPSTTTRTATASTSTKASTSGSRTVRSSIGNSSRAALSPKDQNAELGPRQPPKTTIARMPYERSPNNGTRPQMPSLSTTAQRGSNRAPLTPKIATTKAPPQTPAMRASTHTPLARQTQRPTTATSRHGSQEDELASHFTNNITPRSGSRQSRVDSVNSTPSGTPNPDRFDGWDRERDRNMRSPKLGFDSDAPRRPIVTLSSVLPEMNGHGQLRSEAQNTADSKFFYASDAKPGQHKPTPPPPNPAVAKSPTFFYASTVEKRSESPAQYLPAGGQAHAQDSLSSKFFYANGTPDLRPIPPAPTSRPGSVISSVSKATSRPGSTSTLGTSHTSAPIPGSPAKLAQPASIASQRNSKPPPIATNRPPITSPPQLGPTTPALRRTSSGMSRNGSHSRNESLVSEVNLRSSTVSSEASSPSIASASQPAPLTLASIIQAAEDFAEDEDEAPQEEIRQELQSPTKSTHSTEPVSELVANARRERKVQDLQITNASLEAINRTLERQLRKQTAELRRYKRLSRAGRLSMASTTVSNRADSDSMSMDVGADGLALSDLDEENSEEDDLEDESFSDTDSAAESLSPSVLAEKDAKYRKRDEDRLQLDLSKHQELLTDSQRINQSIKRCLNWTEELIKDGKKALSYNILMSDVELGGRVLTEDEIPLVPEDIDEDTLALDEKFKELDDEISKFERMPPRLAGWTPGLQDSDSGKELSHAG